MAEGDPNGGSVALGELIDEHGPHLLADFQQEYGLRLADVVRNWSAGEVLALVEGLPASSRYVAHVQGGDRWREFWGWDRDRHMRADLLDVYIKSHTEKGKRAWEYPRPESNREARGIRGLMGMIPKGGSE